MKKRIKKLSLNRETLSSLEAESLEQAAGASVWSACFCTNYSACCSNECGTQLCW
jgi:hypothetical protein